MAAVLALSSVLYANRDAQFRAECDATPLEKCDDVARPGSCDGCPCWEGLRSRVAARLTAGEEPAVLTRRSESAP